MLDADLRVVLVNPAFVRLAGVERGESIPGLPLAAIETSGLNGPALQALIERQLRDGRMGPGSETDAPGAWLESPSGESPPVRVRVHALATSRSDAGAVGSFMVELVPDEGGSRAFALHGRIADYRRRIGALSRQLAQSEERQRQSLARDLHDGLSQALILASMKLGALRDHVPAEVRDPLRQIEGIVREAHDDLASLTFRLSPPLLHDSSLEDALQWIADETGRRFDLGIELKLSGSPSQLSIEAREEVLRAARELLINVAKHAGVKEATLELENGDGEIRVTVSDRGVGFDPAGIEAPGFGLVSLRERAHELGGALELDSSPGKGTRAALVLPTHRGEG